MSRGKPPPGTDLNDHFLARWSRRKHAAAKGTPGETNLPAGAAIPEAAPIVPRADPPVPEPLPPVESLTPESDFAPFMRAEVDEVLKRRALKTLFRDPRFNVMDGLDVYIDDFSKPDPLPEGWLEKMNQVARLGDYRPPEEAAEAPSAQAGEAESTPSPEPPADPPSAAAESRPADTPAKGSPPSEVPES